jgi:antitoxin CptB
MQLKENEIERRRLSWRLRRGMLENDLLLSRFMETKKYILSEEELVVLNQLLDLPDSVLLKLLMGESEPENNLDTPEVRLLIRQIAQSTSDL